MAFFHQGICRHTLVPVRKKATDRSEMVTQLLFGEHYKVVDTSNNGSWLKIENYFDGYHGWIDKKQHNEIPKEYYDQLSNTEYRICTDLVSNILYKRQRLNIVLGSILPISTIELFGDMHEQFAFNGSSKNAGQRLGVEQLVGVAMKYLNAPYLWGGKSPFGIDCSGFVQQVFRLAGYRLKRDASEQYLRGKEIASLQDALPGDLAFFKNDDGDIVHVGIILEENKIIHASGKVRLDLLNEKGIFNDELNGLSHKLAGIKRYL